MKIFLTGSSGFVGSQLLPRLLREAHSVRALVHGNGSLAGGSSSQLEQVKGDILSASALPELMAGCDAVINLVGIIFEHGSSTFEAVHHLGTRNLVQAARQIGLRRFVQMSALGARREDASPYHTTKFAGEEEVRDSGIPYVILRPSLIVGHGSAFIHQMVGVMRVVPFIRPVAGTGEYRFRPVHVDDVAECFTQALTNEMAIGQTVNLVGNEELTLNDIAATIAQSLAIHKIPIHIPIPLMKVAATLFSVLPMQPPVTKAQIRMLEEGSTADPEPMKRIFGLEPRAFRSSLNEYLRP
ncbi:MAG: NAD(P)H-binding protein [Acidobacteria bacterium]|nr:NAD(P)H-binding protein [Acidobacteriota bacterium]MBV9145424.1 NAD(P)H-binding protein [Acidobacteriota bacterium]MBV9438008.1 NAD(P)H-binding protein [Acidobacteriota bacterium]